MMMEIRNDFILARFKMSLRGSVMELVSTIVGDWRVMGRLLSFCGRLWWSTSIDWGVDRPRSARSFSSSKRLKYRTTWYLKIERVFTCDCIEDAHVAADQSKERNDEPESTKSSITSLNLLRTKLNERSSCCWWESLLAAAPFCLGCHASLSTGEAQLHHNKVKPYSTSTCLRDTGPRTYYV